MTTSYLLMASPRELLRSRCPFPTTTQRRHLRLPREQGGETQKEPPFLPRFTLLARSAQAPSAPQPLAPTDQASPRSPASGQADPAALGFQGRGN